MNILFICSDQHAASVTGCYGNDTVATPALDGLAAAGVVFDAAYCNAPLCVPSRMSMMTGRYPFQIDCLDNGSMLDSRIPTWAHLLGAAGYDTALVGRMHFVGEDQFHGFAERRIGDPCNYRWLLPPYAGTDRHDAGDRREAELWQLANCRRREPLEKVGAGLTPFVHYDRAVAAEAVGWLRERAAAPDRQRPFLLTVGLFAPHCPYLAPTEFYRPYQGRVRAPAPDDRHDQHPIHAAYRDEIGLDAIPPDNLDRATAAYYALTTFLDRQIAAILTALERSPFRDNTIMVYASDHGEMLGAHGRWHKECFFEDSARVPLIIRHPDCRQSAGSRRAAPVSLLDLAPTLAGWADVTLPFALPGRDLGALVAGPDTDEALDRPVKVEVYGPGSHRMIRWRRWKLCAYGGHTRRELFDLAEDAAEATNLAGRPDTAAVEAQLTARLYDDGWNHEILARRDRRFDAWAYHDLHSRCARAVHAAAAPNHCRRDTCWPRLASLARDSAVNEGTP